MEELEGLYKGHRDRRHYLGTKALRRRCSVLQIAKVELAELRSLSDFKALVKKRYREMMRRFHPDHRKRGGRIVRYKTKRGKTTHFGDITKIVNIYKYLMSLTEKDFIRMGHQRLRSVQEYPMPLDWEGWPVETPLGFQETRDHLWYQ